MEAVHDAAGTMNEDDVIFVDEERRRPIISGEQLDIEAYAALYTGRTKISRLLFIAGKCGVSSMELEALRMAYEEIKKGTNTQLFREVVAKINGRLGPNYGPDFAWADAVDRRVELREAKLLELLNTYRSSLIKESIWMGYNDFGDFCCANGLLAEAYKNYIRSRDFCSTSKQMVHLCLNVILVGIEMGRFAVVASYVSMAEQSQDDMDPLTIAKLRCAAGLAHLGGKSISLLLEREFLHRGDCPQDIATYGSLCALASFDRAELKCKVMDNDNFKNFLELVPEIRELIDDFYTSHYASCLEYLENCKSKLLLDFHLHDHVEALYEKIRNKALIQYTLPFVSVDLHMMASAFKTSIAGLQKELEVLIASNQIQARIDSHNKILYAQHADQRNSTFQRVLQTSSELEREARAMLFRAKLKKHYYKLKASRKR